ncbi:MAG: hypothetical protein GX025_08735 [Clostridiales bacterium]|nr:hypothetical protein [Clostridiales bacterium]
MRKHYSIITIILVSLILLCSCSASPEQPEAQTTPPSGETLSPLPSDADTDNEENSLPTPSPTTMPSVDNSIREAIFMDFITDIYEELSNAFFGAISGIGFIDLDMDGGIEMIIFDAGASASMGVQFFDIIDGRVECVSASMQSVRETFGGEHMSDISVNANYFEDFRLMKDKSTGEMFYLVSSGNGGIDFSYRELIRFNSKDDVLTLTSLMYKEENYDEATGDTIDASYKIGKKSAALSEYTAAYEGVYSAAEDTGLEAKGAFIWDNQSYTNDRDGIVAMAKAAIQLSRANFPE